MLKITLISLLLLSNVAFSQVADDFFDGDFTQNPSWHGDVNNFQVNPQKQLQSKGQPIASQVFSLSTVSQSSLNTVWEFFIQLNFDPTSTNFARVYLISDKEDLKTALNGYFVQTGETGSTDGFYLYRQTGNTTTRIITGPQKNRPNPNVLLAKIKVSRDAAGKWTLWTDLGGADNFTLDGSVTDLTHLNAAFMGVYCRYATASRYDQFIFDNFSTSDLVPDVTPPVLKSFAMVDSLHLDATFSEPLEQASALKTDHYFLSNDYETPLNVAPTTLPNVYRLTFSKEFLTAKYTINVHDVQDKKGNVIADHSTADFFYVKPYPVKYGDVVINEILANPAGSPALPQKEFTELWNTTDEYVLMQGWKYSDQTSSYTFLADTLEPHQHVLLCAKADAAWFKPFGKTVGLSPWPSLNNDQDILTLRNKTGQVVDQVAYYDRYYKDELKKKGGFSLELIDPKNRCSGIQNWSASTDEAGGTPGKQNSVYHAQMSAEIPKLLSVNILDSLTFQLEFSKSIDSLSAVQTANYSINNGTGRPLSAQVRSALFNSVILNFASPLIRGIENTLTVTNVTDCAGNLIDAAANSAKLFMAKKAAVNDILISEVLFNPKPNGVDFVEIYNHTGHVLDLKEMQLATIDANGNPAGIKNLSAKTLLIQPESYWVISSNTTKVKTSYFTQNPEHFIELSSLPGFNNDKGTVVLLSNERVLDRFDYSEKMHHAILGNADGVSLERVSFLKNANAPGNFKSAAASAGFATPTYKNSQEISGTETYVKLVSKTFSPDYDGFEDVVQLDYQLAENANLASINIFSEQGVLVKKLLKNQTLGTKGSFTWDGLNDAGNRSELGLYIILFDVFDLNGHTKRFRNTCILAAKLN